MDRLVVGTEHIVDSISKEHLFDHCGGNYPMNYEKQLPLLQEWVDKNEERLRGTDK